MRQRGEVPLEHAEDADDQQPAARIERRLIGVEEADQILDLLVADHPADKHDVRPVVVELPRDEPVGRIVEMREVGNDRQHRRAREAERFEILAVELRIAEREIAAVDVGVNLAPAAKALARQRAMDARRSTRAA